jgi:hypothetical protein
MKIVNPFTKTIHIVEKWSRKTYRVVGKGKMRRSYIKHYSFKRAK